jgi:alpha/beta hydrolase family protein
LKRPETDPLVIHTQTATEYWQRRGSLDYTDTRGNDLLQPAGVRIYLWASSQHFADPLLKGPERGVCQNYRNTVATSMLFRAMIDAMDRWATSGIAPPESRVPYRADGTCRGGGMATTIPGDPRSGDAAGAERTTAARLRTGDGTRDLKGAARYRAGRLLHDPGAGSRSGRQRQGRRPGADGAAPLGTYSGWNLRARGFGHGAMHEFSGSYIPLPETPEERRATGRPEAIDFGALPERRGLY